MLLVIGWIVAGHRGGLVARLLRKIGLDQILFTGVVAAVVVLREPSTPHQIVAIALGTAPALLRATG